MFFGKRFRPAQHCLMPDMQPIEISYGHGRAALMGSKLIK
jgi:hypothetical protein